MHWFGRSSAPEQHLSLGILRAVEQRRWIARSTNTGISAFVDPTGAVVARSGLFKAESLSHQVVPLTEKSVFFTLEPWLPWAGLALFSRFSRRSFRGSGVTSNRTTRISNASAC